MTSDRSESAISNLEVSFSERELRVFTPEGPWDANRMTDPHLASDDIAIADAEAKITANLIASYDRASERFKRRPKPENFDGVVAAAKAVISHHMDAQEREIEALERQLNSRSVP